MGKTIVICSDGTWNEPDQRVRGRYRSTNVAKMAAAIVPVAGDRYEEKQQIVFYDAGVGTGGWFDQWIGGVMGRGLDRNIKEAYTFLVNNYQPGDEVYCFGFSRGAFTVRSLAGLIGKCDLLTKEHWHLYHRAYDLYRNKRLRADSPVLTRFRGSYTQPCPIKFIGVWDTVGALGVPVSGLRKLFSGRYAFHNTNLSPNIPYAYHALAIDEYRGPFRPALWKASEDAENQTVEQVWFAGTHHNVGGGSPDAGLEGVAFMWMKEKAQAAGLVIDEAYVNSHVRPNLQGRQRRSRTGIYRLLPTHMRDIGTTDPASESVHPDVVARHEQMRQRYSPFNLLEAKERGVPAFPPVEVATTEEEDGEES